MPTENELLGIINGQRKYYRDGILKLVDLLKYARQFEYAEVALSIADNYGIIGEPDLKREYEIIKDRREQQLDGLIVDYLSTHGEVRCTQLKRHFGTDTNKYRYDCAISRLLKERVIEKRNSNSNTIYRLAS